MWKLAVNHAINHYDVLLEMLVQSKI